MIKITLVLFLCVVATTKGFKPALTPTLTNSNHLQNMAECAKKSNVDLTKMDLNKDQDASILESEPMQCFLLCMAEKNNEVDASGKLNYTYHADSIKDKKIVEKIKKCSSTETNKCKKYFETVKCIINIKENVGKSSQNPI